MTFVAVNLPPSNHNLSGRPDLSGFTAATSNARAVTPASCGSSVAAAVRMDPSAHAATAHATAPATCRVFRLPSRVRRMPCGRELPGMVVWLERRLSALAEEACDAAVLARGVDPHDYCESLVRFARSVAAGRAREP